MNRIRQLREEKGMTQQQLADALGVNQSTVDRYEKGIIELLSWPAHLKHWSFPCVSGDEDTPKSNSDAPPLAHA